MTNKHRLFKGSQLYDWHAEPKKDRGSSFFHDTAFGPTTLTGVARRAVKRRVNFVVGAIVLTAMLGIVALFNWFGSCKAEASTRKSRRQGVGARSPA